jgi:hypothetical protein
MSLTTIATAPTTDDFIPLSEHHEQTPGSFFAGKPVLHLQAPASKLQVSKEDLEANEAVKALVATTDDAAVDADGLVEIQDIDIWVTSRYAKHSTFIRLLTSILLTHNTPDIWPSGLQPPTRAHRSPTRPSQFTRKLAPPSYSNSTSPTPTSSLTKTSSTCSSALQPPRSSHKLLQQQETAKQQAHPIPASRFTWPLAIARS